MNHGNVVGLPGSTIKCPFEVRGHEFKARPVSMAVAFPPASGDLKGQSWGFAGGCDGGKEGQRAEGVGRGVTLGNCDKQRGEDTGECDDDGKMRRSKE